MRSSPTSIEPDPRSERDLRAAMMRRLGITEDPPAPEPPAPRLKVVSAADAPDIPADEQQLEDLLSRFGIDDRPQPPARQAPVLVRAEPNAARAAEFDIPAMPLQAREPQAEPEPEPEPVARQSQAEMLEELRRQLKGSRMTTPSRVPVPPIVAPTKAQKRRAMGEMAYTRLVIWLLAIVASGLMTYNVVKASVEHDRAMGRPSIFQTLG
ncbi:MAG TPA: hypothetical protein VD906_15480 [Caulobacteraceae bacterium]|nr:hypothetical protein [Caulobacteraceae bacterium]